ncbi:unnamed protein product [Ilex paraguariensis]|uniref:Uncharacterized protein n=1 Tax=Ilex paraguariensis TaxID=185542 RepID=A0ABC8UP50_9AQUA
MGCCHLYLLNTTDLACNNAPNGCGGAILGVQYEVVHIKQLVVQQNASTLNKSSISENDLIDLSGVSSEQVSCRPPK